MLTRQAPLVKNEYWNKVLYVIITGHNYTSGIDKIEYF